MKEGLDYFPMECGFNRYMVECKSGISCQFTISGGVLIDTWWNVNV